MFDDGVGVHCDLLSMDIVVRPFAIHNRLSTKSLVKGVDPKSLNQMAIVDAIASRDWRKDMPERSALAAYDAFLRRNRIDMWLVPDSDPKRRKVLLRKGSGPVHELPIALRASGDPPQELMAAQMLRSMQYLVLTRRAGGAAVLESLEDAFLHEAFDDALKSCLGDLYETFVERVGFEAMADEEFLLAA